MNRIQEIMDLEHFKTLTPIQEQVLNRKNKNRDIIGVSSRIWKVTRFLYAYL